MVGYNNIFFNFIIILFYLFFYFVLSQKNHNLQFFIIIIVEYWLPEITIGARRASQVTETTLSFTSEQT